jgi:signal transduction histidine kinase/CHASE3 domain sensor protein
LLLVISVVVLLIAEALTFRQISSFRESAERVHHTHKVEEEINTLFSHYAQMQADELRNILKRDAADSLSWELHKDQVYSSVKVLELLIQDNEDQQTRLTELGEIQKSYYSYLQALSSMAKDTFGLSEAIRHSMFNVTTTFDAIRNKKNEMLQEEGRLITLRKMEFDRQADLAPLFILLLVLFSLAVFLLAFARIYRNKERVRNSEAFLQSILRNTTNIVNYYEPVYNTSGELVDYKVVFANECNKTYLGIEPENIVGKHISEVFPFLRLNGELDQLKSSFLSGEVVTLDRQIAGPGTNLWFTTTVVPHGNGILVTGTNNTKAKADEEELRALNEKLRSQNEELTKTEAFLEGILRSTKNVILTFKPLFDDTGAIANFELLFVNRVTNGIIDLPEAELVGKPISEVSPILFNSRGFEQMAKCYTGDRAVEVNINYGDSTSQTWLQGTAIRWHNVVTLNLTDVSRMVRAEQGLKRRNVQLKRTNEELESFNRVASHDLQEPLRKIQMFISRVFESEESMFSKEGGYYLNKIQGAAERMQSLIVNLLAYSKIDNTHENFEEADLNLILKKVMDDLAFAIRESGAKIEYQDLPVVKGVAFQLEQLFSNLVSNALKYRRPDAPQKIVIRAERKHRKQIAEDFAKISRNYFKLSIIDNGIGFGIDNAEKIFEVFQRLHPRNEYSGNGIGLAICKKIVQNHMGHIYAMADPGQGATFVIYLPD